jgi:hypothetical protein
MRHYVEKVQQPEFAAAKEGYTFVSHQQEVGTGYFDKVTTIIQGGASSVTALTGRRKKHSSDTSHRNSPLRGEGIGFRGWLDNVFSCRREG